MILVAAKVGGKLAARVGQPHVIGELAAGLIIGNLTLGGYSGLAYLKTDPSVDTLAQLGVILLLFQVGLESTVAQMARVGFTAFLVAVCGVVGSFAAGWTASRWLLPSASSYTHMFLGATLTATSVGVTARMLKELGRLRDPEARVILGAAVVDDVIGLVVLAVITAFIAAAGAGEPASYSRIVIVLAKAVAFCAGGLAIGMRVSPHLLRFASKYAEWTLLACSLAFCFAMAWLARLFGLAPLIGAFAAGLVIEEWHYADAVTRRERTLADLLEPIASFLVPVFFVVIGLRADLSAFAQLRVLGLASALLAAAIIGKLFCAAALAGTRGAGINRLAVCVGMVPRGEVELIFANVGLTLAVAGQPVISPSVFSAIVVTVMATTVMTPPALKWSFARQ